MARSHGLLVRFTSAVVFLIAGVAGAAAESNRNWSGIYLGAHAGKAWSETDWTATYNVIVLRTLAQSDGAVAGGLQVGLQKQFGNVVAGVEVSWSATQLEKTQFAISEDYTSKIDRLGLVTARLGWASNGSLLYVKGGWATASYEFAIDHPGLGRHAYSRDWQQGWTLGGGLEYALTSRISLAMEYSFTRINVDSRMMTNGSLGCPLFQCALKDAGSDIQNVTARLNFKLY